MSHKQRTSQKRGTDVRATQLNQLKQIHRLNNQCSDSACMQSKICNQGNSELYLSLIGISSVLFNGYLNCAVFLLSCVKSDRAMKTKKSTYIVIGPTHHLNRGKQEIKNLTVISVQSFSSTQILSFFSILSFLLFCVMKLQVKMPNNLLLECTR